MRKKLRNWHTHEGSIWIAVEISTDEPRAYRIIILRRNTLNLAEPEDWIAWDQLEGLYQGVNEGMKGLQAWLMKELEPTNSSA